MKAPTTHHYDFAMPYIRDLAGVIDMDRIRSAGVRIGADPLGGASVHYWEPVGALYDLDITLVNSVVDPAFAFMRVDHDGKIRMDCSSPYAMAGLVGLKDQYEIAFANDADADRHGIVTRSAGLMNPNHYLAVAIQYLLTHRPEWPQTLTIGKTLVSSGLIDRVVAALGRSLSEVPVGFKWFVEGLFDGSCCFGGEESAGASFLQRDRSVWTPEDTALQADLSNEVERTLAPLSDREKEVLRLRYGLGADREYTLEEIGRRLSVTRERVRQIESRALEKLRATKQREAAAILTRRPA
jgi:phosphoglucomutase